MRGIDPWRVVSRSLGSAAAARAPGPPCEGTSTSCRLPLAPSMMVTVCMPAGGPLAGSAGLGSGTGTTALGSAVSALDATSSGFFAADGASIDSTTLGSPPDGASTTAAQTRKNATEKPRTPATPSGSRTGNFDRLRFLPWPSGALRSSATGPTLANHAAILKHFGAQACRDLMGGRPLTVKTCRDGQTKRGGPEAAPRINVWVRDRASVRHGAFRVGREGRIGPGAAQELERRIERPVVLGLGRDIGLRAGLLVALRLEMAAQRGLALGLGRGARLHLLRHFLQDLDVGRDALGLDRLAGRREVARRGEAKRAVAGAERNDGLHRALAERAGADDGRALLVLQGAGHDLGGRSRAAVDQDDQRLALGEVAGARVEALGLLRVAAAGRYDLAALQEGVGDRDRLIQQPARIVAQIDDIALELLGRNLRRDVGDRLLEAVGGLLVERRDADVTDVFALDLRAHRAHPDDVAHDRHLERLVEALAHDLEADLGVDLAAHLFDGLIEGEALDGFVVEMGDDVAGANARLGGRSLVDRRHDLDQALFLRDLDAQPAELAARLDLPVAEALRVHVARMRIEPVEHPVDGRLDQLGVVRLFDIVRAHPFEDVAEQTELAVGIRPRRLGARADRRHGRLGRKQGHGGACRRAHENQESLAHHPRTFSLSGVAHHGFGSAGDPSLRNSIYSIGGLEPAAPVNIAEATCGPLPMTATGSPVNTNWPISTEIRSMPARTT